MNYSTRDLEVLNMKILPKNGLDHIITYELQPGTPKI